MCEYCDVAIFIRKPRGRLWDDPPPTEYDIYEYMEMPKRGCPICLTPVKDFDKKDGEDK